MPTTPLAAGRRHRRPGAPPAGRRRRVHLAVQLPAREHGRARSGPRSPPATPIVMKPAPQDPLAIIEFAEICEAGRLPARRRQRRHRLGARGGAGARRLDRRRHDLVHRLDGRGRAHLRGRRQDDEAPAARARRQGRVHRVRRRRPRQGDRRARERVGLPLRPDLHRADARDRAPLGRTTSSSAGSQAAAPSAQDRAARGRRTRSSARSSRARTATASSGYIQSGADEGARARRRRPRPDGVERGYYVGPDAARRAAATT